MADEVAEVAETYCACALPGNKMCVQQFEAFVSSVSDACSQCVFEHERRCASMQTDCTQLCLSNQTPPGGP